MAGVAQADPDRLATRFDPDGATVTRVRRKAAEL
jgi:hypothetical protein